MPFHGLVPYERNEISSNFLKRQRKESMKEAKGTASSFLFPDLETKPSRAIFKDSYLAEYPFLEQRGKNSLVTNYRILLFSRFA